MGGRQTPVVRGRGSPPVLAPAAEPSAASLVRDLRAPSHRQPINPKANYRTRDIQLFEDAAACIERLSEALGCISRMRTLPDDKANTFTLGVAHRLAAKALGDDGKVKTSPVAGTTDPLSRSGNPQTPTPSLATQEEQDR